MVARALPEDRQNASGITSWIIPGMMSELTSPVMLLVLLGLALLVPASPLEGQEPGDTGADTQDGVMQLDTTLVPGDTVLVPVGPLQPDIYVADLSVFDGLYFLGPLQNVTNRDYFYDDQPVFTPDSRSLLYVTELGYGDRVQTEVHRYYLSSRRESRITRSPESEYSPMPIPGDRAFSTVRVEDESTQRLWRFTMQGMDGEVLFKNLDSVQHHVWGNETTVLLYLQGPPPTARIADLTTGRSEVVARGIGRSMNKIPNRNAWSFVERISRDQSWISEVNIGTHEVRRLIATVGGGEFHAWTPEGVLLMSWGSRIYQWDPEIGGEWRSIANLEEIGVTVGRIAVSPDGSKIAVVGIPELEDQPVAQR